jgi:hypothetical protein
MPNFTNDDNMAKALLQLSKLAKPKVSSIAGKYKVNQTTLSRYFNGTQRSWSGYLSESRQCITSAKEQVVID